MKYFITVCLLLSLRAHAQEENLDPSIFDGTGIETEKAEPQKPSAASPGTPPESRQDPGEEAVPAEKTQGTSTPEAAEEETPREVVLPEMENGEEESSPNEEPGIPAAGAGSKSRAGETVNSTEKIAPGQAVDFPWDM